MADFTVPIATNVLSDLNDKIAAGAPRLDFSFISNAPENYDKGVQLNQDIQQRNLFQNGIPNNPGQMISDLARVQGAAAAPAIMNYYKMLYGQQVDRNINGTGGQPGFQPQASSPPSSSTAIPSRGVTQPAAVPSSPVPSGPLVPSSSRVMGDAEGVRAGLYDPPATAGARPPVQSDGMTPNATVASRFPSSGALVSPDASDPTLGGLVPQGRTPAYQRALLSSAIASGMLSEAQTKNYQARIDAIDKALDQYRQGNVKNSELTNEQKNANSSGSSSPLDFQNSVETNKQDADTFQKRYTGIQSLGEQSYNGLQKAQLMKNLTLQPGFYSGPFHEGVQTFNQFKSVFGSNPSSALPQEAFNKVVNDMLTEQVKAMGQSGVGRVLQTEVNTMKQAIASLGITPQSNRALAEIVSRVYKQNQDIAEIARSLPRKAGQMNTSLDTAVNGYLQQHKLFTPQELQHPETLGAPDAPPQSAHWSPQQKQRWAQSIGLKSGDAIRFNGQVVSVP